MNATPVIARVSPEWFFLLFFVISIIDSTIEKFIQDIFLVLSSRLFTNSPFTAPVSGFAGYSAVFHSYR